MHKRIEILDAIRGFALFGILLVNIMAFSSVSYGSSLAPLIPNSTVDSVIAFLISALFEMKFYLLFSFLFGCSFILQIRSAQNAETALLPRMLRRHAGLFIIGAFHAVFLFHGDILTTYAVLGTLLLLLQPLSDRAKLFIALSVTLVAAFIWLVLAWQQWQLPAHDETALAATIARETLLAWRGGPTEIIGAHIDALSGFLPLLLLLQMPCAFAMFCVGFVAGKRELFQTPELYRPHMGKVLLWGSVAGLPGAFFYAATTQFFPGDAIEIVGLAISILTAPFLTLALLAALLVCLEQECAHTLRVYLAAAGRMALSNYLLQSLVCAFVFHGYGFGLMDKLSMTQTSVLAVIIFSGQLLVSHWWLNRFRYGPVEWLLRALTIWAAPPFRRTA